MVRPGHALPCAQKSRRFCCLSKEPLLLPQICRANHNSGGRVQELLIATFLAEVVA